MSQHDRSKLTHMSKTEQLVELAGKLSTQQLDDLVELARNMGGTTGVYERLSDAERAGIESGNTKNGYKVRALAEELIQNQSIMTLATRKNTEVWAAPVYYVYHKFGFYFFSDPGSRHIQEALESGQIAVAIHVPSRHWREIRGMQMSGQVEHVSGKIEPSKAVGAYLKKFPFTKEFITPGVILDIAAFKERFRVNLYRFAPSVAYYLDNRIRFGFREEIVLK